MVEIAGFTPTNNSRPRTEEGRVQDGREGGQLGPDVEEEEERGELRHEL